MKAWTERHLQAGLIFFMVSGGAALSSGQPLTLLPDSTLTLAGDSTLHPFMSTATVVLLRADAEPVAQVELVSAILSKKALKSWELIIPVKGLKSKESGLDKNMYRALKAEEYPEIIFKMTQYDVLSSTTPERVLINGSGLLSIAGTEQTIQLNLDGKQLVDGLLIQGRYTLLMTDYGIKPPSLMMGAIKVRNPITIQFSLHVR